MTVASARRPSLIKNASLAIVWDGAQHLYMSPNNGRLSKASIVMKYSEFVCA